MPSIQEYPHPSLAVDCIVFGEENEDLDDGDPQNSPGYVVLVRRKVKPFRGKWALPGGFVRTGESVENAAQRELNEETGLNNTLLSQCGVYSLPERDPRGHVVSIAYTATVSMGGRSLRPSGDAQDVAWFALDALPPLAFDHDQILADARRNREQGQRYSYQFPRPALTVDCVVFGVDDDGLKVLLIQRGTSPYKNQWALPGGFVHVDETVEEAARRELREETNVDNVFLEQLYTIGEPLDRDPRERVVTVAYYALVKLSRFHIAASTDARNVAWHPANKLPRLAFDHQTIVDLARQRLQAKVRYEPVGFELLPPKFTLTQLQHLYEGVLDRAFDKRNFRKKVTKMKILVPLDEYETNVSHRAAQLFRFDKRRYRQLVKDGQQFNL